MIPKLRRFSLPIIIVGTFFLPVGLYMFFQITAWGNAWEERVAAIEAGEVQAERGVITKKYKRKNRTNNNKTASSTPSWCVTVQPQGDEVFQRTNVRKETWDRVREKDVLDIYRFGDRWHVPTLDQGGHKTARWYFLGFGLLPLFIGLGLKLLPKETKESLSNETEENEKPTALN